MADLMGAASAFISGMSPSSVYLAFEVRIIVLLHLAADRLTLFKLAKGSIQESLMSFMTLLRNAVPVPTWSYLRGT